jgi:PAS domain S-box-containing protein
LNKSSYLTQPSQKSTSENPAPEINTLELNSVRESNGEAVSAYHDNLKKLNQIAVELSRLYSLDELCRHAVESGRNMFGFDRMGIWLLDDDPNYMIGTFGTTEDGQTRDERGIRLSLDQQGEMVVQAMRNRTSRIFERNAPILNHQGETVGYGGKLFALLWNGDDIIGSLSIDNLLTGRPITNYDLEILTLYGSIIGHLIARIRAETALLNERNLLRTIIDTTADYIYVKDKASRFLAANRMSWSHTPGTNSEADMIGRTDFDFFPAGQAERFRADEEKIFTTGQPILNQEEVGRTNDDSSTILLTTKIPLRDQAGEIIGIVGVSRDITDVKHAEAVVRESEERLRLATHSAKIGTWDWSLKTDKILLSDYTHSLLGISQGEFTGTLESFMTYIDPRDHDAVNEAVRATFNENRPLDIEYRIRNSDGELRWMHSQAEVIVDETGQPLRLIGIIRDITEQKQSESERFELALQKERLDLLAEFIGNMSHDLKTPLSVIQTCLYLLERLDDPIRQRAKLQTIKEQTQLLERLIQDVLTMSKLDHGSQPGFAPVNLNLLIHDVVGKLRPTIERKNLSTRMQLDVNLAEVWGSEDDLRRMLTNLVENALNYTPEHGTVVIRTFPQDKAVAVEVSDTGIGIDAQDLPRIFDRFYRADPARSFDRGGTGLGLAIVKRIVDMHSGDINVQSEPGGGSIFRISLKAFR